MLCIGYTHEDLGRTDEIVQLGDPSQPLRCSCAGDPNPEFDDAFGNFSNTWWQQRRAPGVLRNGAEREIHRFLLPTRAVSQSAAVYSAGSENPPLPERAAERPSVE